MTRAARLAVVVLLLAGCGSVPAGRTPRAGARHDAVQVRVRGTTIAVPAPEGLADILAANHMPPQVREGGDVIWGIFEPRELVESGVHRHVEGAPSVMVVVPRESSGLAPADSGRFAALSTELQEMMLRLATPEGTRLGEALGQWRQGTPGAEAGFASVADTARSPVEVDTPEPHVCQMVTVERGRRNRAGTLGVWCDTRVLVRGRILTLLWVRDSVPTLAEMAATIEASQRWAHAVLAANP